MKRFFSLYHPRYPRSLVYMLQSSEYNLKEFWTWFKNVKNFSKVEDRKSLVLTLKAKLLLLVSYLAYFSHLALIILILIKYGVVYALLYVVAWPYVVLLKVVATTIVLAFLQRPVQKRIVRRSSLKLQKHKALKIGIAGSFGKTTMKEILKTVLSQSLKVRATPENKNTPMGIASFVDTLKGDEDVLIFEMGEYYPGDIKDLSEMVRPDIGIVTGVNEAHLEKFKTLDNAAKTIFEIADYLEAKGGRLFVNAESEKAREFGTKINSENLITYEYSSTGVAEFKTSEINSTIQGLSFVLKSQTDSIVVRSKLLGTHQVGPLSLAAYIAVSLNMKTEDIELGLHNTHAFAHRLEPKEEHGGVVMIDDTYNGNPDGVKVAINFLKSLSGKRRFYITPGLVEMGDKSETVHKEIGRLLAESGIEKVVLVKNSVTGWIEEGLKEHGFKGEVIWYENAKDLFKNLPLRTVSNDVLLYQNDWPDQYS